MPLRHIRGMEVWFHAFLTSALDVGKWSAWCPGRFIPSIREPSTHWLGGRMGCRVSLGKVVKRKNPIISPVGIQTPVIQPTASSPYWVTFAPQHYQKPNGIKLVHLTSFQEPFLNFHLHAGFEYQQCLQ